MSDMRLIAAFRKDSVCESSPNDKDICAPSCSVFSCHAYVCVCVCVGVCVCVCLCVYYAYILYICIYICIHTYVCIYIY
jgi:hypothetical protein